MTVDIVTKQDMKIAIVNSSEPIITDVSTVLDFFVTMQYDYDTNLIAINKNLVSKDFFVLSTRFSRRSDPKMR